MKLSKMEQIDELFREASKTSIDDLINQYSTAEELEDKYEFSKKHTNKMEKLFRKSNKIENYHTSNFGHRFRRISYNAAAVLCILFTIAVLTAFTVPTVRVKLANYFLEETNEYIEINTDSDNTSAEQIEGTPDYIPYGFYIDEVVESDTLLRINYINSNNDSILFVRYNGETTIQIDNEDIKFLKILISNYNGYMSEKNGIITIIFHDGEFTYRIISCENEDETMKIAESLIN